MSYDNFLKEFKAYFTDLELNDFHEKRLSEMWHKHKNVEFVEVEKIKEVRETFIRPVTDVKILYVDPETMQPIRSVKDPKRMSEMVHSVIYEVCNIWNVKIEDLISPKRKRDMVYARFFCYLKLRHMGVTYTEIGRRFKRDHTSVMAGIDAANNLLETDCQPFSYLWKNYIQEKQTA